MARFLFTAWPYAGCLYPQFAVGRALRARGHEVAFYTGASARAQVVAGGFTHFAFQPRLEEEVDRLLLSPDGMCRAWRRPWRRPAWLRRFMVDTVPWQVDDLDDVLDRWAPDVLISEPAFYAPFLVLQDTRKARVAVLEYSFSLLPGRDVPPAGLGWRPPRSWPARVRMRMGEKVLRAVTIPLRRAASRVRRQRGLAPLRRGIIDALDRLPLTLVPSCPEFDFGRSDLPPAVHYVGPCLWFPQPDGASRLPALVPGVPVVHVTEGTLYPGQPTVLRAAVTALSRLPLQVIVATGRQRERATLGLERLAPNVTVTAWVDYPTLLPGTDLVVTIGGGGTVLASLSAGVPLVVVPMMWDQADNAARIVDAGAGVRIDPTRCSPRRLRAAVTHVLERPSYRQNARRLAAALNARPGPAGAATLLEQLAAG